MKYKLGIDFDNTLVNYDRLFYEVALDLNLINASVLPNKKAVRDFLIKQDLENSFTKLQAEIYGKHIMRSIPDNSLISSLKRVKSADIDICIVSHKTMFPYLGPKYNLHEAALNWLKKNKFFSKDGLDMSLNDVFFEPTKESKIERIVSEKCFFFIDDLPEIISLIPDSVGKVLFSDFTVKNKHKNFIQSVSWPDIADFLISSINKL
tara:strand:- start:257 stop:877 length:621 start_codon:yes stop_codon:yes gene_type:complete